MLRLALMFGSGHVWHLGSESFHHVDCRWKLWALIGHQGFQGFGRQSKIQSATPEWKFLKVLIIPVAQNTKVTPAGQGWYYRMSHNCNYSVNTINYGLSARPVFNVWQQILWILINLKHQHHRICSSSSWESMTAVTYRQEKLTFDMSDWMTAIVQLVIV